MRLAAVCLLLVCTSSCAKKEPKPLRTEPWLAHAPARDGGSSDAGLPLTRYVLGEGSVIHFELPTKRGALHGTLTRVSGEFNVDLSDLAHSRGSVRADLGSLDIHAGTEGSDAALLERARTALELPADPQAPAAFTSFDLTSIEDASPAQVEPAPAHDASAPFNRRSQFTALGNLLLHGFRVPRRAALSAEFSFAGDRQVPERILIRSRSPLVVSLETHAIVALAEQSTAKSPSPAPLRAREVRVSIELYGTKVD